MNSRQRQSLFYLSLATFLLLPTIGFGTVESTLAKLQSTLIGTILPVTSILGLAWAGISYTSGNPAARNHLTFAILGAVIGFGAPSIVAFVRTIVN